MTESTGCWNCKELQRVGSRKDWYSGQMIEVYYCDKSREYIEGAEHLYAVCPWNSDHIAEVSKKAEDAE